MTLIYPLGETFRSGPEPCQFVKDLPFYGKVPKTVKENLEYRQKTLAKAQHDRGLQKALREMCDKDRLFWIATFCWLYEPREKRVFPWVPWPHQADILATTQHYLTLPASEKRDLAFEKSRGEGLSWDIVTLFLGEWGFSAEPCSFGLVSRNEKTVDDPRNPDSLMWKMDFQLDKNPPWMFPFYKKKRDRRISTHSIYNIRTGSTVVGYAADGDVASGGRLTAAAFDEVSKFPPGRDREAINSLQPVTDMMIYISSPKGTANEYYRIMHNPSTMLKIISDWRNNPTRNRGMFRCVSGEIEVVDPVNNPLDDYFVVAWPEIRDELQNRGFDLEDKEMSPWLVRQCLRGGATPQSVAQEYERDYGGSDYQFFKGAISVAGATAEKPYLVGRMSYKIEDCIGQFVKDSTGGLSLWLQLNGESPPVDRYVVSWDLGGGTGGDFTSNSVMTIVSLTHRKEVGKWVSNNTSPEDCARLGVATCRWLESVPGGWAMLTCESNAMAGQQFTKSVFGNTTFRNIWYRRKEVSDGVTKMETTDKPFHYTRNREAILSPLCDAIINGRYIIKDRETAEELGQYVMRNGKIIHSASLESKTETGKAHGDRVMSTAIAWNVCEAFPPPKVSGFEEKRPSSIPPDSPMGRYMEWESGQSNLEDPFNW